MNDYNYKELNALLAKEKLTPKENKRKHSLLDQYEEEQATRDYKSWCNNQPI